MLKVMPMLAGFVVVAVPKILFGTMPSGCGSPGTGMATPVTDVETGAAVVAAVVTTGAIVANAVVVAGTNVVVVIPHVVRMHFVAASSDVAEAVLLEVGLAYLLSTTVVSVAGQEKCTLVHPVSPTTVAKVHKEMQAWSPPALCIMLTAADGSVCPTHAK